MTLRKCATGLLCLQLHFRSISGILGNPVTSQEKMLLCRHPAHTDANSAASFLKVICSTVILALSDTSVTEGDQRRYNWTKCSQKTYL